MAGNVMMGLSLRPETLSSVMYLQRWTDHSSFCSSRIAPTRRMIASSLGKMPTTVDQRGKGAPFRSMQLPATFWKSGCAGVPISADRDPLAMLAPTQIQCLDHNPPGSCFPPVYRLAQGKPDEPDLHVVSDRLFFLAGMLSHGASHRTAAVVARKVAAIPPGFWPIPIISRSDPRSDTEEKRTSGILVKCGDILVS